MAGGGGPPPPAFDPSNRSMSELRWHPLRATWVITATHRQDRTFKPPANYCPLCPTRPGGAPTEIPVSDMEVAVFENRFPSLCTPPPAPDVQSQPLMPVVPGAGVCEVVVFSPDHIGSLGTLSDERRELLIHAWRHRTQELYARKGVRYVMIFENRGDEIGVTLSHPHGQIYAYPFIPPVPAQELKQAAAHHRKTGRNLFMDLAAQERKTGDRVVVRGRHWLLYVPFYAQYPYETVLTPLAHTPLLTDLSPAAVTELAVILGKLVRTYDRLFDQPMPYLCLLHQGPPGRRFAPVSQVRFNFLPALRDHNKLKYLAGCEQGAGTFINDTLAEVTAKRLASLFAGS